MHYQSAPLRKKPNQKKKNVSRGWNLLKMIKTNLHFKTTAKNKKIDICVPLDGNKNNDQTGVKKSRRKNTHAL